MLKKLINQIILCAYMYEYVTVNLTDTYKESMKFFKKADAKCSTHK